MIANNYIKEKIVSLSMGGDSALQNLHLRKLRQ